MDEQKLDDKLEPTFRSSVPIRDVVLKTCRKQWTIDKGGERESEISVLMVWHDDDDDMEQFNFIDLCLTKLFEKELFVYLIVCKQVTYILNKWLTFDWIACDAKNNWNHLTFFKYA